MLLFELSATQPTRVGVYNHVYSPYVARTWARSMMSHIWA